MVEFSGVSKTYGKEFEALKNVNLTINDGEFVFVVGASGAGKSTFLKLIMREEVPTSGTVTINGYNLNKMRKRDIPYFRRTMGIVFQDFRLIPDMRVYDNVAFALRVTGTKEREVRKRVTHALGMVGLLSKTKSLPKELSGGEQQRVAIARALVNNADLIIADEPTGNIDPAMSVEIMDLLNHINKANGTTVVMVTHAHDLVKQYDHRIVVLKEGQLIADGYDKEKILDLIKPELHPDAGFYNAPNEYEDVEKFITTYGSDDVSLEETMPAVEDKTTEKNTENDENAAHSEEQTENQPLYEAQPVDTEASESAKTEAETARQQASAFSKTDHEDINAILAAFAASNATRIQRAKEQSEQQDTETTGGEAVSESADTSENGENTQGGASDEP